MRLGMFIALVFASMLSLWSTQFSAAQIGSSQGTAIVAIQQPSGGAAPAQPSGKVDVDINVNRGGGGRWYANPMWIAIGALAVIVLIALIVMAGRGGGTTVVKG
jgi:hypothetical protein